MVKISFYNDTGRLISIHPGTAMSVKCEMQEIKPLEIRTFDLSSEASPFLKLWDYKGHGLSLLVQSLEAEKVENPDDRLTELVQLAKQETEEAKLGLENEELDKGEMSEALQSINALLGRALNLLVLGKEEA
jgi:hypothetical protein